MRKIVTKAAVLIAIVVGMVIVPVSAANATDYSVNMNAACQYQYNQTGYRAKALDPGNAYSWRCRT